MTSQPMPATGATTPRIPAELWILVGAAFAIAIGYGLVAPVLPSYARSFDVGVMGATIIVSIFAAFRLAFAPAGGVLLERLGERPVYVAGVLIVAASSLATAFAQNYWQLLLFRGLGGIGSVMFTIAAMALMVRLSPPAIRGRVSSLWGASFLIGGMVGPVLGGLIAGWGMRLPFILYAVALSIAAVVVTIGLGGARLRPIADAAERPVMLLGEAWALPAYRAAVVCSATNALANLGVRNAVVPLLAVTVLDRTWMAGLVLGVGALGTALTLQYTSRAADRLGRRPLLVVGSVVSSLGLAAMGLSGLDLATWLGVTMLLGLSFLGGLGAGLVGPSLQAAVGDIVGTERSGGRVLSTFQMAADGGVILGPVLIGFIADHLGFTVALAVAGGIGLLGALAWWLAPETLPTQVQRSTPA